jgi:hypothetical protein
MYTNTIKKELRDYILSEINQYDFLEPIDLHHELFNTDYYIIGYYQAEQWLKKHNVNIFTGIEFVQDYQRNNFGPDAIRTYDNAEELVNMITYIIGEELIMGEMNDEIEKLMHDNVYISE